MSSMALKVSILTLWYFSCEDAYFHLEDPYLMQFLWQTWILPSRHFYYWTETEEGTKKPTQGLVNELPLRLEAFNFEIINIFVEENERRLILFGSDKYNYQLHPSSHSILACLALEALDHQEFYPEPLDGFITSHGLLRSDIAKELNIDARSMFNFVNRLTAVGFLEAEKVDGEFSSILRFSTHIPQDEVVLSPESSQNFSEDSQKSDSLEDAYVQPEVNFSVPITIQVNRLIAASGTGGITTFDLLTKGFSFLADITSRRIRSTALEIILNNLVKSGHVTKSLEHFGRKRRYRYFSTNIQNNNVQSSKQTTSRDQLEREAKIMALLNQEKCIELNSFFISQLDSVRGKELFFTLCLISIGFESRQTGST